MTVRQKFRQGRIANNEAKNTGSKTKATRKKTGQEKRERVKDWV